MSDYRDPWGVLYVPANDYRLRFYSCRAVDGEEAERLCKRAKGGACEIVWTHLGDYDDTMADFMKDFQPTN
jgi:hypothetical protein